MKAQVILIVLGISMLLGLVGWLLFAGGAGDDSHLSHREYIPPVTPTDSSALDPLTSRINANANDAVGTVLQAVYNDTYAIYPCRSNPDHQALLLTAQYRQTATGNNFEHAITAVRNWEPHIIQDIGAILYPALNSDFGSSAEVSFTNVPNREYRSAEAIVSGQSRSVYYGWLLNYVIFAPSQTCLENTMNNVYEVGA